MNRLATARAKAIAAATLDSACLICTEPYPAAHLLRPTVANEVTVCPACVFDDNLWMEAFPQRLALEFDCLTRADLAIPAAWTAVAAVLACAAGPAIHAALEHTAPPSHWADPGDLWIWLPPTNRPAALADLPPGSSLRAVTAALEAAHPNLRAQFQSRLEAELNSPFPQNPDCLVEPLWPAAIAYAITFATDKIERRRQRPPALNFFDCIQERALADHLAHLGSTLAAARTMDALITLEFGAQAVATALGWSAGELG